MILKDSDRQINGEDMLFFLSQLKKLAGITDKKENLTNNHISLDQAIAHISSSRALRVVSGLFVLFLLIIFIAMTLNIQQTNQHATYQEVIGHIKMHSQRLAKASQQTIVGSEVAFTQLRNSQNQLNHYMSLLAQGAAYHPLDIFPTNAETSAILLEDYRNSLIANFKRVNLILRNEKIFVSLSQQINTINTTNAQLLNLVDQLTHHTEQTRISPHDLMIIEALKAIVQNITLSINALQPNELALTNMATQLATDQKRWAVIIAALETTHVDLNKALFEDNNVSKILKQIQLLFKTVDDQFNTLQQKIPEIVTTQFSAQEIVRNSEKILMETEQVNHAIAQSIATRLSHIKTASYIVGTIAILTLFVLIKMLGNSLHKQLLVKKRDGDLTQKAILQLLDDLDKVANGDLTQRTQVTKALTGTIADSINFTIEELQTLVKEVTHAGLQVAKTSNQAQAASFDLQTATQQQSTRIGETTTALLDIGEAINEISENALETSKVARRSTTAASEGSVAVHDSITSMNEIRASIQATSKRIKRLGESSQEIGEITTLISDITEQANVLALNSSIKATATGETENKFSLIAQEMRYLAEQATEATKQVSTLVNTIQRDTQDTIAAMEESTASVVKGTVLVRTAGQALEEIKQISSSLAQQVTGIFNDTHFQTQATNKVVRNMEAMLAITRQTTDSAKQTVTSVKEISELVIKLETSAARFKV